MYGIKRSAMDLVTGGCLPEFRGVSKLLIDKINDYGKQLGLKEIIVINPLPGMKPILSHYGFIEYEDDDDESPIRIFMEPISPTYEFFARDII